MGSGTLEFEPALLAKLYGFVFDLFTSKLVFESLSRRSHSKRFSRLFW
jgi:hypothetical protein